ncbi:MULTISPECIES: CotH kinase family protein [Methanoculleus]|nr:MULTISPECIES: CotH kinase family protein [Methanoculleus]UYU17855.1 CotH kinase family protein [Methanoculleus submarinus]
MATDSAGRAVAGMLIVLSLLTFFIPPAGGQENTISPDTGVQDLYLFMGWKDLVELYTREETSDERLDGYVRLSPDGEDIELEGVRFRGSSSRELPKKSFSIRFNESQEFLFGSDDMNLKATYTDPTMMRERLSMDLFHVLGQPAPRTKYFDLYINGVYEGLYVHVERVDGDLLASNGLNPAGTLVADDFRGNFGLPGVDRLSVFGYPIEEQDDPEAFLAETMDSRGEPDWGAVRDLVAWVYRTPAGPEFEEGFVERFDEENFIDWLAIHYLIGDVDSFGDDYWLYLDTGDPDAEWKVIPWDKDLTFGSHTRRSATVNDYFGYESAIASGWDNDLVEKFLDTPGLRERLNLRMAFLMDGVFTEDYYAGQIDVHKEAIGERLNITPGEDAFVLHPQNHHGDLGYLAYHTEAVLDFVRLRYRFIERAITPGSGEPYTASVEIPAEPEGSTVSFTDPGGWVIATFEVSEVTEPGTITATVNGTPENPGIDRRWEFDAGDADVSGELTLYYRNDVESCCFPIENWFVSDAAVRDDRYSQWDLRIVWESESGNRTALATYVNPYSNKASADVSLQGTTRFEVVLPDR